MVLTFHGCTFEVLIFRFLMTSKRRFLVHKREFRGDSLFILDLVIFLDIIVMSREIENKQMIYVAENFSN